MQALGKPGNEISVDIDTLPELLQHVYQLRDGMIYMPHWDVTQEEQYWISSVIQATMLQHNSTVKKSKTEFTMVGERKVFHLMNYAWQSLIPNMKAKRWKIPSCLISNAEQLYGASGKEDSYYTKDIEQYLKLLFSPLGMMWGSLSSDKHYGVTILPDVWDIDEFRTVYNPRVMRGESLGVMSALVDWNATFMRFTKRGGCSWNKQSACLDKIQTIAPPVDKSVLDLDYRIRGKAADNMAVDYEWNYNLFDKVENLKGVKTMAELYNNEIINIFNDALCSHWAKHFGKSWDKGWEPKIERERKKIATNLKKNGDALKTYILRFLVNSGWNNETDPDMGYKILNETPSRLRDYFYTALHFYQKSKERDE